MPFYLSATHSVSPSKKKQVWQMYWSNDHCTNEFHSFLSPLASIYASGWNLGSLSPFMVPSIWVNLLHLLLWFYNTALVWPTWIFLLPSSVISATFTLLLTAQHSHFIIFVSFISNFNLFPQISELLKGVKGWTDRRTIRQMDGQTR